MPAFHTMTADEIKRVAEQMSRDQQPALWEKIDVLTAQLAESQAREAQMRKGLEPFAHMAFGKEIAAVLQAIIDDFDDGRGYTNLDDELADRARAALVLLAAVPQTAISDGWKLVPMEPTEEMSVCIELSMANSNNDIYRAMLAAAPEPNK